MSEVPFRKVTIVENAPLSLNTQELEFFKTQTGLEEEELTKHIYDIQAKAYQVYPYPCIKSFGFAKCVSFVITLPNRNQLNLIYRFRIPHSPAYPSVLQLAKERKDAILLDAGCCCTIYIFSSMRIFERLILQSGVISGRPLWMDGL